jgi:hypothetical protein
MRYKIVHRGVPIGDVELDLTTDPAIGAVAPLEGYDAIRDTVRAATGALIAMGMGTTAPQGSPDPTALALGALLGRELELRDPQNSLVKTDYVEVAEWNDEPRVTVWVRARGAFGGVPASPAPGSRLDRAASNPMPNEEL